MTVSTASVQATGAGGLDVGSDGVCTTMVGEFSESEGFAQVYVYAVCSDQDGHFKRCPTQEPVGLDVGSDGVCTTMVDEFGEPEGFAWVYVYAVWSDQTVSYTGADRPDAGLDGA